MIDPERFARLREIFLTARCLPPDAREDYLLRECGDDSELLGEIRSILAQGAKTNPNLQADALVSAAGRSFFSEIDLPQILPERVGPYEVVGILGAGGMGIVYRARQMDPIQREVAIKLMFGGAETRGVVSRFESERQFLAEMEHPNIAKVLDAGCDETGRPYFVMELVRGVPIVDFCDAHALPLRDRLRLFRTVCLAVQHAHQKGIIHRDLKPSNVLVSLQDGIPHPMLIDFGIAKALGESGRGDATVTRQGQLLGTIEYMSPERIEGGTAGVDTRSDVYSLGVVLYEVVAGELPYTIRGRPTLEALRKIAGAAPNRFAGRRTEWGRLDGELEAIVLKALDKEPERRYAGAGALAQDLDRYLDDQPILARRPTAAYQIRKLIARHKAGSMLAGVLIILSIGVPVARTVLVEREATKQRLLVDVMTSLLTANIIEKLGREARLEDILDVAEVEMDKLRDQPGVQAELQMTIGEAFSRMGLFDRAERHLRGALTTLEAAGGDPLRRAIISNQLSEFLVHTARLEEADSLLHRALTLKGKGGVEGELIRARSMNLLARTLDMRGRDAEAEPFFRESIRIHEMVAGDSAEVVASGRNDYAVFLWGEGRYEDAEALYEKAQATYTRINGEEHTDTATIIANHALLLTHMGRPLEAEPLQRKALATHEKLLGREHELVGLGLVNLGLCLEAQDRFSEATELFREAVRILKATLGQDHPWSAYGLNAFAFNEHALGALGDAERHYTEALEVCSRAYPPGHGETARVRLWRAALWTDTGRAAEAEPELRECVELLRSAYSRDHWSHGIVQSMLGGCLACLGRTEEGDSLMLMGLRGMSRAPSFERGVVLRRSAEICDRLGRTERAALYRSELDGPR